QLRLRRRGCENSRLGGAGRILRGQEGDNAMHITPLDIQQKRFRMAWRGLDKAEVDAYLNLVASELEKLTGELNSMREDQRRQKRLIDEYREREQALKETMITAQRVTEEITQNAKKEADIIIGRAELEA